MALYAGSLPSKIDPQPIVNVEVALLFSGAGDHATRLLHFYKVVAEGANGVELVPSSHRPDGEMDWFPFAETRLSLRHSVAIVRPDTIELDYGPSYPGWTEVREELLLIVKNLDPDICGQIAKMSLRYVNFFPSERDLTDVFQLDVSTLLGAAMKRRWVRFQMEDQGIQHDVTCAEGVSAGRDDEDGVILDVASMVEPDSQDDNVEAVMATVDRLHDQEKRMFMTIIRSDYLSSFEVSY